MEDEKTTIRKSQETTYMGIAAENLQPESIILPVICPELLPQTAFGSIGQGITENTVTLKDREGRPVMGRVVTANHIVATWEGESNRRYPPMVEKGEPVEIYRRGNSDKFFWRVSGRGRDFRKLDRVHIEAAAGDPNAPPEEKNDTNTYSLYADPVAKKMGMKSSKANGEACIIVFEADLAKGLVYLSDDSPEPGNRFVLDTGIVSGTPSFHLNLSTGLAIRGEGEDLLATVPGKMLVQANDRIVFDSPLIVFNRSTAGQVIFNGATIAFNAGRDVLVKAGNVIGLAGISVKLGGVVSASVAKITSLIKSPSKSDYKAPSLSQPELGKPSEESNSPDTDITGLPYRT